ALVVVGPVVVEAHKIPGVAAGVAAHRGAAMAAAVVKNADLAIIAAHDDERPSADATGQEISGLRHLALVSRIEPRLIEDQPLLAFEQLRIAIDPRAVAENPPRSVVLEQGLRGDANARVHSRLPVDPGLAAIGPTIVALAAELTS